MNYSDKDILDLFEDLQGVGLSETPEEQARRIYKLMFKVGNFASSLQASNYLHENKINHKFYSIASENKSYDIITTNLILVNGFVLFMERIMASVSLSLKTLEETIDLIESNSEIILSKNYFDDISSLPKAGYIRSQ